jgi:hypothetical protein
MVDTRLVGSSPVIFLAVTSHRDNDRVLTNLLVSQVCSYRVSIDRRKSDVQQDEFWSPTQRQCDCLWPIVRDQDFMTKQRQKLRRAFGSGLIVFGYKDSP